MSENSLRWRARIGSLRWIGLIVIILAGIGLVYAVSKLLTALQNPGEPQSTTIEQIVNGSIGSNQYVILEGFAMYDTGYEETEDGIPVATYYLLVDDLTGHILVVQSSEVYIDDRDFDWVTLTGITHKTSSDLRGLIRSDSASFQAEGFVTTADLYLAEGESPSSLGESFILAMLLGALVIVSAIPFFYPMTVFIPKPVEMVAAGSTISGKKGSGVKATGRFLQLKKVEPSLELGKRKQKFANAVANVVSMDKGDLMIYIHHVVRYNFIPVSKTHWGVFLNRTNVRSVEPGLQLGWTDRPAVQFSYMSGDDKSETLLLTFDHVVDQAGFMQSLREMGFKVGSGISAPIF